MCIWLVFTVEIRIKCCVYRLQRRCATVKWCRGSGRNTWRFCRTALSGTFGVGNLSRSALLARLKAFQLPWSAGLYSIGLLLWRHISKTTILSCLRGYFVGTSTFIRTSVPSCITFPLRISQEQGVRKETKDNGGFVTEHQGKSGSNFSQHVVTSEAHLPETLGGMYWQGMPPHRHYIQKSNVVIKMI